jgi:uncharacterized protein (DUF1778 family)
MAGDKEASVMTATSKRGGKQPARDRKPSAQAVRSEPTGQSQSVARARSDTTVTMRIPTQSRVLIDTAAAALGKSRTEFMLDSARQSAQDVLLDQRVFSLDEQQSEAFARMLAEPVPPIPALRALMKKAQPWR